MLVQPGLLMAGRASPDAAAALPTYAEWLAHIDTRREDFVHDGQVVWRGDLGRRLVRVDFIDASTHLGMVGTTFGASSAAQAAPTVTNFRTALLHAFPSREVYDDHKANKRSALIDLSIVTETQETPVPMLTRNGFTAAAAIFSPGEYYCFIGDYLGASLNVGVSYWDSALGKPMSYFPRAAIFGRPQGPFDYQAAGWPSD